MAASFQTPKHKSTPIQSQDEWTVREKLSLASSVMRSGDQNWVSVSRAIKPINETGRCGKVRPPEFFSQKNCAILYSQMLEKVNTPKRKRTSETGAGETPGEQIVRRLTFERIEELKKSMKTDQLTYRKLKMRIEDIRNGKIDQQLPAIWEEIQARKRRMEEMQQMQVSTSGSSSGGDNSTSPLPGGSPVAPFPMSSTPLFGGLKQATQATTPSPQKGKQLRIPKPTPKFQKYQQQLQQRHQAGQHATPSGSPGDIGGMRDPTKYPVDGPRFGFDSEPLKSEPMDIDPGTAVQTVSVDMPPTPQETSIPKAESGVINPTVQVQLRRPSAGSVSGTESLKSLLSQPPKESMIELSLPMKKSESFPKKGTDTLHPTLPTSQPKDIDNSMITPPVVQATTNKQLTDSKSFLGQKSPMDNHKVDSIRDRITPAAPSVTAPTLSKLLSSQASPTNASTLMNSVPPANSFIEKPLSSKAIDSNISITSDISGPGRGVISVGGKGGESGVAITSISVNPKAAISDVIPSPIAMTPPPVTPPAEKKEIIPETLVKIVEPTPAQPYTKEIEDITIKDETEEMTADHTLQPENKIEIVDTPQPSPRVTGRTRAPKPGRPGRPRGRRSQRRSKSVTSTDNETEMEEEKEEDTKSETIEVESEKASEKDEEDDDMESTISEKKDDSEEEEHESIDDGYSESGDRSKEYLERASTIGSESVPASPASQTSQGDMDPESLQAQKTWKKSIMLVWRAAANHKYANVFLHAVTDDEAPGYHSIVFRPMDLTTIKKNIENGTIRTTSEFQRDMMLMFQNALMYNSSDHDVYRMAEEMRDDVMDQIQSYIATQLMVQSSDRDSTKMLRGHRADVFHFFL